MIGYYIHHCGRGHLNRAVSITTRLRQPVTALTSLDVPGPHPFDAILTLPRDDDPASAPEPTAHGALHWAPHHHTGLSQRMALVARWIAEVRPHAIIVDVSVEIASLARLLGVPVIVMALPGERTDTPHRLVHQLADHIIAAWPRDLYEPDWLRCHADKTTYVGGISRFDGREPMRDRSSGEAPRILVVGGAGGGDVDQSMVDASAAATPQFEWSTIGLPGRPWRADPWQDICAADVVVTHAGQGLVADVATAQRRAVILPEHRPFDEQRATAQTLRSHRMAQVLDAWPSPGAWPRVIDQALALNPAAWERWQTRGAADRAAEAIASTARRYAPEPAA